MEDKIIAEEDHNKALWNIHPINIGRDFKGCLFVYDDEFEK